MNPTVNLIFTIVGGALVLVSLYGAVALRRKFFLFGLCLSSFLPMIGEFMAYNTDKAPIHILIIFVFVIQFILALPLNIVHSVDNTAAIQLTTKIGWALLIINVVGAVFVLDLTKEVPAQFGYYHIGYSLAIIFIMIKRISSKGTWVWAK